MGLLSKVRKTIHKVAKAPITVHKTIDKVARPIAVNYVRSAVDTVRHPTLKGIGTFAIRTGAAAFTGGASEIGFAAYDLKRNRQKNKRAEESFRRIKKSALQASSLAQQNIRSLLSLDRASVAYTATSPIQDTLAPLSALSRAHYGFAPILPGGGGPGSTTPDDMDTPAPEDKGTSGSGGGGVSTVVVVGGVLVALYLLSRGR